MSEGEKKVGISSDKTAKKQSVRKLLIIFLLVMTGCCLGGFASGFMSAWIEDREGETISALLNGMEGWLVWLCPIALIILFLSGVIVSLRCYLQSKKAYTVWDGEDEAAIARVEKNLSRCVMVTNIMMVLNMFFLGAWLTSDAWIDYGVKGLILAGVLLLSYFANLIFIFCLQYKVIELEKKINPEKQGNALDFKFAKKWEASCDEREMMIQYRAAYKAFKLLNHLCMGLWIVCLIGEILLDFGLAPMLMVTVIWLASLIVYQNEAMKLENN